MTDKCIDKRIGDRLYAWEAGLLKGSGREEFERHLVECAFCARRAQAFRDESRLIRHDGDLRDAVGRLAGATEPRSWYRSTTVRSVVALAAVLALLLLRPWQLEFSPTQEAVATENRLLVAPFADLSGDRDSSRLGEMIANLMIADLAGCPTLRVVSDQRSRDVQRLVSGLNLPAEEVSLEVARRTRSRWLMTGKVARNEHELSIAAQVVEVRSGDVEAAYNLAGSSGQAIFALVDSLTVLVRGTLGLPETGGECRDLPVADVTTSSADAYLAFLEGVEYISKYYTREAVASFKQAVEFDSTFAMAYYYLARYGSRDYLDKAVRFSDRATRKERLYIQSLEATSRDDIGRAVACLDSIVREDPDEKQAWFELGRHAYSDMRYGDAARYCHRAADLDPLYKQSYGLLAYVYQKLDRLDSALWAIDEYIRIAPDEPNPYDTRGDLYAEIGRIDEAAASYETAVGIKRDFASYTTLQKLAQMHAFAGRYDQARALLTELAQCDQKAARSRARTELASILLYRGKLDSGLMVLDDGIAADRLEQATSVSSGDRAYKHYLKATVFAERGLRDSAVMQVLQAVAVHNLARPDDRYSYRYYLAQVLAEAGALDSARAVAEDLRAFLESKRIELSGYRYAQGCLALAEGRPADAAAEFTAPDAARDAYFNEYMAATALLAAGQPYQAAEILQRQVNSYGLFRRSLPIWSARCHYLLGIASEETGQTETAVQQYRRFLEIWSEADRDLEVVAEARSRLERLTRTP